MFTDEEFYFPNKNQHIHHTLFLVMAITIAKCEVMYENNTESLLGYKVTVKTNQSMEANSMFVHELHRLHLWDGLTICLLYLACSSCTSYNYNKAKK